MPKEGPLTVVVLGLVAGLNELHKKFASPRRVVLHIELAKIAYETRDKKLVIHGL